MIRVVYVDSSALVKLVVREAESEPLQRFLTDAGRPVSCALARVEVARAVRAHGVHAVARARELMNRIDVLRLDDELLDLASDLDPLVVRSLDAVHLAAAQTLGSDLGALVTYDVRMASAATALGLGNVASPGVAAAP